MISQNIKLHKKIVLILIIFFMILTNISSVYAGSNDGNPKEDPYGDTLDIEKSYDTESFDTFIPYTLTYEDIGGYAAWQGTSNGKYSADPMPTSYRDNIIGTIHNIEFESFYTGEGTFNSNNPSSHKFKVYDPGETSDKFTEDFVIVEDSNGNQYYLAAFPQAITIPKKVEKEMGTTINGADNTFYNAKNRPLLVDVILTDGTIIHFLQADSIDNNHSNGGSTKATSTSTNDGVTYAMCELKHKQYRNFFHAQAAQVLEIWCRHGGPDKFNEVFNIGTDSDKNKITTIRIYDWDWNSGAPTRLNGQAASTKGSIIKGERGEVSLIQEFIGGITSIDITDGSTSLSPDVKKREEINNEIYNSFVDGVSTNDTSYSLYDRFGPKLEYFDYLGEETTSILLLDYIITKAWYWEEMSLQEIAFGSKTYLSNKVYENRPTVLNQTMVKFGYTDPRVAEYTSKLNSTSRLTKLGKANFELKWVAQNIISFTNLFITNDFFKYIANVFNTIAESDFYQNTFKEILMYLLGFVVIVFIFSIVRYTIKFEKGNAHIKQVLIRFLTGMIAMGFITALISHTVMVNNAIVTVTTVFDEMFAAGLEEVYEEDEVISGGVEDNNLFKTGSKSTTQAAIWKVAIFEPWCVAMFGDSYENLYTQFSDKKEENKLPQSHEDVENLNFADNEAHFDSASLTGDVTVDVGKGKQIRNWAALAWSIQSKYHIDASEYIHKTTTFEDGEEVKNKNWPTALMTADNSLYADTFRIIDAKMNISPQYYSDGSIIQSYSDSNPYILNLKKGRWMMRMRILLLIVLWPTILRRLVTFLHLISTVIKGIYFSFVELVKENAGYSTFWPQFKKYLLDYVYFTVQLYILVTLYIDFVGKGGLWVIAYLILAYMILNVKLGTFAGVKSKVRRLKQNYLG